MIKFLNPQTNLYSVLVWFKSMNCRKQFSYWACHVKIIVSVLHLPTDILTWFRVTRGSTDVVFNHRLLGFYYTLASIYLPRVSLSFRITWWICSSEGVFAILHFFLLHHNLKNCCRLFVDLAMGRKVSCSLFVVFVFGFVYLFYFFLERVD